MTSLVIRSAQDAIAAVPYLLGFHPARSLVVIGFEGRSRGTCAVRLDLPSADAAGRVAAVLSGNGFARSLLLGYGPAGEVAEAARPMRAALAAAGVPVAEAIRVADGRWWSLTCDDVCCPPEGTPYDIHASTVAAEATFGGHVALADRAELVASVQPLDGAARAAMHRATERAEQRCLARPPSSAEDDLAFVLAVLARARTGSRPTDDEVAWLGLLLADLRVRDETWTRLDADAPAADIAFWRDIVRRVDPAHVPAPASLLAFAAYSAGDGGLANVALQRALDTDPAYSMAVILREVVNAGIPPAKLRMRTASSPPADHRKAG
ncbi:DUF4192 domain-containing protein [Actinomadura citrea]|uniref:DUF4192 domain-containing protein n=1 Tax=Actinomadura citrea TaxID=46158 RepID=A0A7Y9GGA4_9ACTN|nr:DUF4192 domain-containing protein [Actinomadura citrea]NYE15993.1 hypothetical protein [Actinomadura citrea]GGT68448.1 hypothetical protein GCM10010177_27700 [Actinomadura citrea]